MFYYVQLWQDATISKPTIQQRLQASSEAHAVVQVMKAHHLSRVDRAWISCSAKEPPTLRLVDVLVQGKIRRWRHDPAGWRERHHEEQKKSQPRVKRQRRRSKKVPTL
jgi:hypothetical protein